MQMLKSLGGINIVIEIIWLLYMINECMDKEYRKTTKFLAILCVFQIIFYVIIKIYIQDLSTTLLVNHIYSLILIGALYYKSTYNSIIAYSSMYIIAITTICIVRGLTIYNFNGNTSHMVIIGIQICLVYFTMKKSYFTVNLYRKIRACKYSAIIIAVSFIVDYILQIYRQYYEKNPIIIINLLLISYILFFSVGTFYFLDTKQKADMIFELNRNLDFKNNQLRIIKEDHESQIKYLNHLSQSDNFNEAGAYLKEIINEGQNYNKTLEKNIYKNSIINMIIRHISNPDIQIIVDEKYDLSKILMPDIEIYRVMINIINNAVKAMSSQGIIKGHSIIKISVYEDKNNQVISIENNGPPIKKEYINDIFKEGFTTKDDKDKSHGFGLSIVKDLVEKYQGKIQVESCEELTKFKIIFNK